MDKTKLTYIGIALLLLALGFGAGKYSKPAIVKTTSSSKEKTIEMAKKEDIKKENKDKVVIIKETTNKDLSKTKETVITDKGTINTNSKVESKIETTKESKTETITIRDIGLNVGVIAVKDFTNFNSKTEVAFTIKKRVWSSLSINGFIMSDMKKGGLGLGWDF